MRVCNFYILICCFCYSFSVFGQIGGNSTYSFLNLPVSARVSALGGNLLSTRDHDLNAAIANPALLTDSMDNHMSLSYINYFADVNYGYAAFAKNIRKNQNLSAGINFLNYGNFIRADETGANLGTFAANEMCLNLSYARSLKDSNLTVGATLKTIYSGLDTYTSLGSALDIGAVYALPEKNFAVAAIIKNAGFQWKPYVKGNREKLPFEMQIGFTKKPKHVPFRFSATYENLEKWDLTGGTNALSTTDPLTGEVIKTNKAKSFGDKLMRHMVFGGEFIIGKNFFLRAGYNYQRRKELKVPERRGMTGFSFGFGLRIYKFHISYGRAVYSLAGASNNFSVTFDLNSFYSKK